MVILVGRRIYPTAFYDQEEPLMIAVKIALQKLNGGISHLCQAWFRLRISVDFVAHIVVINNQIYQRYRQPRVVLPSA